MAQGGAGKSSAESRFVRHSLCLSQALTAGPRTGGGGGLRLFTEFNPAVLSITPFHSSLDGELPKTLES